MCADVLMGGPAHHWPPASSFPHNGAPGECPIMKGPIFDPSLRLVDVAPNHAFEPEHIAGSNVEGEEVDVVEMGRLSCDHDPLKTTRSEDIDQLIARGLRTRLRWIDHQKHHAICLDAKPTESGGSLGDPARTPLIVGQLSTVSVLNGSTVARIRGAT